MSERGVLKPMDAAVMADNYALTHKHGFGGFRPRVNSPHTQSEKFTDSAYSSSPVMNQTSSGSVNPREERLCFFCKKPGHRIADCRAWQSKNKTSQAFKPTGFVRTVSQTSPLIAPEKKTDSGYEPFIFEGLISLPGAPADQKSVRFLRDTGASQSFMLADVLPVSEITSSGANVIVQGIEMGYKTLPLHRVHVDTELASGCFDVAVCSALPVVGVMFIMGNDIAGGKVRPLPEVVEQPKTCLMSQAMSEVFPACVLTRAQARKQGEDINLSESVLAPPCDVDESETESKVLYSEMLKTETLPSELEEAKERQSITPQSELPSLVLPVTRENLVSAQQCDQSLRQCFDAAVTPEAAKKMTVAYFVDNGMLIRKWSSPVAAGMEWGVTYQIVVPVAYRPQVLSLAHENPWSGHLGVTKTYNRVLKHFFWPGLKNAVAKHCRSCHVCQITGKPNQVIPPAPLCPIPVMGEPFQHVIVDCVGPLPKAKSGQQFLLTIMCIATRFPEAIPLRTITAKTVIKALTKFFSIFGFPKIIQTDQGTNFLSKHFKQFLHSLSITHRVSSVYHPESQGALERWHQTLKSALRKYCLETGTGWDEAVPFALFALREAVQESLGFSPAELVFGHAVRGPLKVLKEQFMSDDSSSQSNVLDCVSQFKERLHDACLLAKEALYSSQRTMKRRYDEKAVVRSFKPGDQVLVLLPILGSALSARFSGPYTVEEKLSETDYVIRTPDRKRQSRVCHINMLKTYHVRETPPSEDGKEVLPVSIVSPALITSRLCCAEDEDGLVLRNAPQQCARLTNSESLLNLSSHLAHLPDNQCCDIVQLIGEYPELFGDIPSQTTVLQHDIDVNGSVPVRQHPYRINAVKRDAMKQEVQYLLDNELAKPSSSPWSSPCLLVPKPDGTARFCTDFRKVNAITVPDSYPLPRMEDCIDNIGSAKFVTKLDLLKGYWQVPLTPRASEISAFVTPDDFLQYNVLAFGLRNAPATFQRLVNTVLAGVPNCYAYLDDLVVKSDSWSDHVQVLRIVFDRLAKATLTLNLAKCEFGKATVTYLGKQVGRGQVRPVEAKVAAIAEFPAPTTRRELRRFLGMAGYYRSFCRNFSVVVAPLTSALSVTKHFEWTPDCQHAFESVKALLCSAPVLAAPDFALPFQLEVDASALGAGAVLLQEDAEGVDHPVCFFSRKFNKHQIRYSTIEKEALALLLALQFFEVYLGSSSVPIDVYTDHNPLVFLYRMYNQNQRLMRWSLIVQNYNIVIKHKKGKDNVVADALSRV